MYKGEEKFTGIFSNGKKWKGIGKEIISYKRCDMGKEITIYEGEFNEGKKNGKGKEYYEDYNTIGYDDELNRKILIFEGVYKVGERWKGKEYDEFEGKLIFEGEFKNGKRWKGKGKELRVWNKLVFEGVYKDGGRWKGKEYDYEGRLIFEGVYKAGKRWKGKEYDYEGKLIFQGEYEYDCRWNGKGK